MLCLAQLVRLDWVEHQIAMMRLLQQPALVTKAVLLMSIQVMLLIILRRVQMATLMPFENEQVVTTASLSVFVLHACAQRHSGSFCCLGAEAVLAVR